MCWLVVCDKYFKVYTCVIWSQRAWNVYTHLLDRLFSVSKAGKEKVGCRLDLNPWWCSARASHEIMRHFAWACFVPFAYQTQSSRFSWGLRALGMCKALRMIPIYIEPRALSLLHRPDQALGEEGAQF